MARKLEFDKGHTLQKAMRLFWEKGYGSSSMEDLVQAMEINRFSIYNTFGDKKSLLLMALQHYRESVLAMLIAPLKAELPAKACLENYLNNMCRQLASASGGLGCFVQRTGQSHIANDPEVASLLLAMMVDLRSALTNVVRRAKVEKSLSDKHEDEIIVDFILSQVQGLIVLGYSGKKLVSIESQIELLKEIILQW